MYMPCSNVLLEIVFYEPQSIQACSLLCHTQNDGTFCVVHEYDYLCLYIYPS